MIEIFKKKFKKPIETYHLTYNCEQPYTIEKYINHKSYRYSCQTCRSKSTIQYAITNGIGEPIGSIYYCTKCSPVDINSVVSQYLALMGYAN